MLSVPQRYRQTDRRTTYDSNTALALRASRGKNVSNTLQDIVLTMFQDAQTDACTDEQDKKQYVSGTTLRGGITKYLLPTQTRLAGQYSHIGLMNKINGQAVQVQSEVTIRLLPTIFVTAK